MARQHGREQEALLGRADDGNQPNEIPLAPTDDGDASPAASPGIGYLDRLRQIISGVTTLGVLYGITSSSVMGCQFAIVKLVRSYSPFLIMWYRSLTCIPYIVFTQWEILADYGPSDYVILFLHGTLNTTALLLAYFALGSVAQVGNITSIVTNQSIPGAILGLVVFGDSIRCRDIFLFIINVTGVVCLCRPSYLFLEHDQNDTHLRNEVMGATLAVTSLFCYTGVTTCGKVLASRNKLDPAFTTFTNGLNGIIASTIIISSLETWRMLPLSAEGVIIATIAILSSSGAFLMLLAVRTVTVTVMSTLFTLSVPVSFALGCILLGEIPHWLSIVGAAVTVGSTFGYLSLRDKSS